MATRIRHSNGDHPDTLAVNLSSDRVRVALTLIEGIRNGQSLGALLGYRFERGLHDEFEIAEVDKFIYPLPKAFPLVADSLASTKTDPNVPIEAIEARNVLDGKKLVDRIQSTNNKIYPYGLSGLPNANDNEQTALNDQTGALLNAYDALADLALAGEYTKQFRATTTASPVPSRLTPPATSRLSCRWCKLRPQESA